MKAIGWIAVAALGTVGALLQALTMSKIWDWFLSPQYGGGPSNAAWYGLSVIFGFTINSALVWNGPMRERSDGLAEVFGKCIGVTIALPLVLLLSWTTGSLFGWL
jgi:hypothetical protein